MLFNSFNFLFLFLPVVLGTALLLRGRLLLQWLVLSSFAFYALAGHVWFLGPMLVTTALDFWTAPRIAGARSPGRRRAWLALSLCGNLGLLFYFKYAGLFAKTALALSSLAGSSGGERWASFFDVMLPAGISFYTFQTLSYVIDVYRGHTAPVRDFWLFAGFVSFFPHLVAGPLTRHDQLVPGLERVAREGITPAWRRGLFLFTLGLAKKTLVADRIAEHIDPIIDGVLPMGFTGAWCAALGYSLQIYFDFSAYSDMAIGLGRLFGVELPMNFDSPYQASDPRDFWRRWHMTLSLWLRDYLYIPLGGGRGLPWRVSFNLIATMVLGGLWHGANWTFAAWGLYHGLLLALYRAVPTLWEDRPVAVRRAMTFLAVTLGWVFFRAPDFAACGRWFAALAGGGDGGLPVPAPLPAFLLAALAIALYLPNAAGYKGYDRLRAPAQAALGLLAAAAVLMLNASSRFLYFQF